MGQIKSVDEIASHDKLNGISSKKLLQIIANEAFLPDYSKFLDISYIGKYVDKCEKLLQEFDNGKLSKYYHNICDDDQLRRLRFFQGRIENLAISEFVIDDIDFLKAFTFSNCEFHTVIVKISISELTSNLYNFFNGYNMKIGNVIFEDLTKKSWRDIKYDRIIQSDYTFKRSLYLELGKQCNCDCSFCRNNFFDKESSQNCYSLSKIRENLHKFNHYIDTLFIGGGEPTLRLDDLEIIVKDFILENAFQMRTNTKKIVLITNGSTNIEWLKTFISKGVTIYFSRHCFDNRENLKILNPKSNSNIISIEEIAKLCSEDKEKIVFTPVCVKGGLDSSNKIIEYIAKVFDIGINKIIISSMQKDASMGNYDYNYEKIYVNSNIFLKVKQELVHQGYKEKTQICSTGGYLLSIFKKGNFRIAFKEYFSLQEEDELWNNSIKKSFDFSMSPNGDIFENWREDKLIDLNI